ncbi:MULTISPECIES: DUF6665 family protein [Rhizobium]|uniref:Uncharacterized protein n=1 Tax=Rhizobium favelukesii TaxID=348824 RepID=W6RS54_9HYPH|nr:MULTISPECIES: DUF6665 family protein [Rhizobium]MCA0805263.1 hypothetical protein [Rhizobium sp. T1473]MCS0462642.1 hypothetical protein [Rhizobium favelukesii]UFS79405.1 hypothetical protein LPB79_07405 [Rhizobium sp. T136]CDM62965.1 hypothetical protein LPU83_pLPU83d_1595 [Rhizobium favelukesii]
MSLRPPRSLSGQSSAGLNPLEYELASARADALGRQGRKMEAALARLASWSPENNHKTDRQTLLDEASDAVWALFIQREICGLHNDKDVIKRYQIPGEVLARLGATRK